MQPESPKFLEDIRAAAGYILEKTRDKSVEDYLSDDLLKPAVERHFEIIGEALNRLKRCDLTLAERISDHERIIAFRNVLIHGYDAIDDHRVWDAIEHSLPTMLQEVEFLLRETTDEE